MTEHGHIGHQHQVRGHDVVLDIGGEVGALLIYTAAHRVGDEIEVCKAGPRGGRAHSQVHPRFIGALTLYAAVYPELEAGDYVCCGEASDRVPFAITGGAVTELDWR